MPLTALVVFISLLLIGILPLPTQWVRRKTAFDELTGGEPQKQVVASRGSEKAGLKKKKKAIGSEWSLDSDDDVVGFDWR